MSEDQTLIPVSDEQAGAIKAICSIVEKSGDYIADLLGDAPKDLVALLAGDKIKHARVRNLQKLTAKTKACLEQYGIDEEPESNLKISLQIIIEAADENRDELQELWARLLAASMHPDKSKFFRLKFIEAAKKLDPLDIKILLEIYINQNTPFKINEVGNLANHLKVGFDQAMVSIMNLEEYNFLWTLSEPSVKHLTSFGKEFLRAVKP